MKKTRGKNGLVRTKVRSGKGVEKRKWGKRQ